MIGGCKGCCWSGGLTAGCRQTKAQQSRERLHRRQLEEQLQVVASRQQQLELKQCYVVLNDSIDQQCDNLRVQAHASHSVGRGAHCSLPRWPLREVVSVAELFLVENIEVGAGAHYTGELLCTHRIGPNRNDEVIRAVN